MIRPTLTIVDGTRVPHPSGNAGQNRFLGFSRHDGSVVELLNRAAETGGIDAILFRSNFRRYGDLALNRPIDACHRKGIALLAMKIQGAVVTRWPESPSSRQWSTAGVRGRQGA